MHMQSQDAFNVRPSLLLAGVELAIGASPFNQTAMRRATPELAHKASFSRDTHNYPIYVCIDCHSETLLATTFFQVQAMIVLGSVMALLGSLVLTLALFADKRALKSPLFVGTIASLILTLFGLALITTELLPGSAPPTQSQAYINLTCARRYISATATWAWYVVLLLKLIALYPSTTRSVKQSALIAVLWVLKARIVIDYASVGILCAGANAGNDFTVASSITSFISIMLELVDNTIVTSVLLRKSWQFYQAAHLRMGNTSRRTRLLVESTMMTFVGVIPPQLGYAIGIALSTFGSHEAGPITQYWFLIWSYASVGIFGVLSTWYSSIGTLHDYVTSTHSSRTTSKTDSSAHQRQKQQQQQQQEPQEQPFTSRPLSARSLSGVEGKKQAEFGTETVQIGQDADYESPFDASSDQAVRGTANRMRMRRAPTDSGRAFTTSEPTETLLSIFMVEAENEMVDGDVEHAVPAPRSSLPFLTHSTSQLRGVPELGPPEDEKEEQPQSRRTSCEPILSQPRSRGWLQLGRPQQQSPASARR